MEQEMQTKRLANLLVYIPAPSDHEAFLYANKGYELPETLAKYAVLTYDSGDVVGVVHVETFTDAVPHIEEETDEEYYEVIDLDAGHGWQPVRPVVAFQRGKERVDVRTVKPVVEGSLNPAWPLPAWVCSGNDQKYIDWAKENLATDELEFDDAPAVSDGNDAGAFVAAWVWVRDVDAVRPDAEFEEGEGEAGEDID